MLAVSAVALLDPLERPAEELIRAGRKYLLAVRAGGVGPGCSISQMSCLFARWKYDLAQKEIADVFCSTSMLNKARKCDLHSNRK